MNFDEQKQAFKSSLEASIKTKCAAITRLTPTGAISYNEGKDITTSIDKIFFDFLGFVPKQVIAAEKISLVILAPSTQEKIKLLKQISTTLAGVGGLAAIITGIGLALGWGSGMIAAVIAWFTGTSIAGPIGWITGGVALTIIAGYFYFSSNDAKNAERFEKALIGGMDKAIDEVWQEHGNAIFAQFNHTISGE